MRLALPARMRRDTGVNIRQLDDPELIAGVVLMAGVIWPDDRGFFAELCRLPQAAGETQISAALGYPDTIKALHYHCLQTDIWVPLRGQFQMVLFDLRPGSATFGAVNTIFAGEWRPWRVRIPPGVGHGYKVLGQEPGLMVYATDRIYDPADEGRIAYDDGGFNYDWETQFR